ncbi:hypothetical protein HK096_007330 [Nowakowskiella sp. JEL0078]|nr:hypothetical protein HK096_007330 [Nowakowskiella sp. JEL0078]
MRHRTANAPLTLQISMSSRFDSSSKSAETATENCSAPSETISKLAFEKSIALENNSFLETLLLDGHEVPSSCPIAFDFSTPQNLDLLDILISWQRIKYFMTSERLAFVLESTRKERRRCSTVATSVSLSQLAYERSHISSYLLEEISTDLRKKIHRRKESSSCLSQSIPLPPKSHPARLANVLWRRWNQVACKSSVVSPVSLGWMKDLDTYPMYGPLYLHHLSNNIEYEPNCFPSKSESPNPQRRQSADTMSSRNATKYVYSKPLKSVLKSPCFGMDALDILVKSFSHEKMAVVHPGGYPKIYVQRAISREEVIDALKNYPTYNNRQRSKCRCSFENSNLKNRLDSVKDDSSSTLYENNSSEISTEMTCSHLPYDLQRRVTFNNLIEKRTFQRSQTEILDQFGLPSSRIKPIIEDSEIDIQQSLLFEDHDLESRKISGVMEQPTMNTFLNSNYLSTTNTYHDYWTDFAMQHRPIEESNVINRPQFSNPEKSFTEITAMALTDISDILATRILSTVDKAQGIASDMLDWSIAVVQHPTSSGFSGWTGALLKQSVNMILPGPSNGIDLFQRLEEEENVHKLKSKNTSVIGLASSLISIPTRLGSLLINGSSKLGTSDTSCTSQIYTSATLSPKKFDFKESTNQIDSNFLPTQTKKSESKLFTRNSNNNNAQAMKVKDSDDTESTNDDVFSVTATFVPSDDESNDDFCDTSDIESDSTIECDKDYGDDDDDIDVSVFDESTFTPNFFFNRKINTDGSIDDFEVDPLVRNALLDASPIFEEIKPDQQKKGWLW